MLGLVATGMTNAQAAQRLFLSPRTVQRHLNSVYRKLGVDGRERLAAMLVQPPNGGSRLQTVPGAGSSSSSR